MPNSLTKVVYRPNTESTEEFILIVNPVEYNKWKGDRTIPLMEVVDSFQVFHCLQGAQGNHKMGSATRQTLETVFGTAREDEVARMVLERGEVQSGNGFNSGTGVNAARGSFTIDTKAK